MSRKLPTQKAAPPEVSLKGLLRELAEERGFDLRGYKPTTLERRFRKRMFELNIGSYATYAEYIRQNPNETNDLLNSILINVTEFFRDLPAWEILRTQILPAMLDELKPGDSFRAWSAGCASGEEPYSLAIILNELLGRRLPQFDVKIYATDIDQDALTTARRGEYPAEALRRVRPKWREKYFQGEDRVRVNREIRRLVIFGRSDFSKDAPISHVNLLACRNVLIYFRTSTQREILARLNYALEPGGILFLGKAESQLTAFTSFERINPRWRIFRKIGEEPRHGRREPQARPAFAESASGDASARLEAYRPPAAPVDASGLGIIAIGADGTITQSNAAALALYGLPAGSLVGQKLENTDLYIASPELGEKYKAHRIQQGISHFRTKVRVGQVEHLLDVTLRPVTNDQGQHDGSLIAYEDVPIQDKLLVAVNELESTSVELQSANEELETTNEELQSANEELETTNEELQSTNEELETTNEELQSLNEELQTANQELEEQGREVEHVNSFYEQALERIPLPVMLVTPANRIEFWNSMALRLFGFRSKPPVELEMEQLPLERSLRNQLIQRIRAAFIRKKPIVARALPLPEGGRKVGEVQFSVVEREGREPTVLMVFRPESMAVHGARAAKSKSRSGQNSKGARRK